jgi:predicted transglutaminase-like cysteine proteinase
MVRIRRPAKTTSIALAAALALGGGASAAMAEDVPARGPGMPLGALAPAPEGFLDLCERAPSQCPVVGPVPDAAALRAESNRRFWAATLSRATGSQTLPAPAAPPAALSAVRPVIDPTPIVLRVPRIVAIDRDLPSQTEAARSETLTTGAVSAEAVATTALEVAGAGLSANAPAAGDAAAGATDVGVALVEPSRATDAPIAPSPPTAPFSLDREAWRMVNGVNRRLNRDIRRASDAALHGREDHWTVPVGDRAQGDCEDYVLAKRADLIAAGVPAEALSIAIVETSWGESHAVLLLASDRGEYVLDSLSPWISRWDRVDYRWRERQVPGRSFDWVSVAL